jgi:hypothetical protein
VEYPKIHYSAKNCYTENHSSVFKILNPIKPFFMKKVIFLLLAPVGFIACSGGGSGSSKTTAADSTTATVTLPYTAVYSSDFVPGKQSDVVTVLNNYKAWETNDMASMKSTYGDSVQLYFPSGFSFTGTTDSLMTIATKYRDSLSGVKLVFYAWTSNHSVDKNEDWVNVWYKETDTYKTGKIDSTIYEDDNRLNNGKIVWVSSHSQMLKR